MACYPSGLRALGLRIHPTKTALIAFRKPKAHPGTDPGNGTFDFLGLTHYWTTSRRGFWVIKRRTARKRLRRTKKSLWRWCPINRHAPLQDQYQQLCQKLRGHFRYLWYPRELPSAGGGPSLCGEGVAVLAESSQQQERDWLGEVPAAAGDVGPAHTQRSSTTSDGHAG